MDVGTSGGIWGLAEGYIDDGRWGPGGRRADPTRASRRSPRRRMPDGVAWAGHGAGHFVKMVHNGIEYGIMESYAEGFAILDAKKEYSLDLSEVARIWQRGSVIRSWLLDLTAEALKDRRELDHLAPFVADSGEGAVDRARVARPQRLGTGHHHVARAAHSLPGDRPARREAPRCDAAGVRRPRGHDGVSAIARRPAPGATSSSSSAATGDLMERKLLPALYAISGTSPAPPPTPPHPRGPRRPRTDGRVPVYAVDTGHWRRGRPRQAARAWAGTPRLAYQSLGSETPAENFGRWPTGSSHRGARGAYRGTASSTSRSRPRRSRRRSAGSAGRALNQGPGWTRIVIEKPFGRDLASARSAQSPASTATSTEREVYRIDHYLGKETVQNLLVFRFANMLFESVWNRDRVDHVEITVAEDLGVEERAAYYDHTGALRDMVQSHLTQLLALRRWRSPSLGRRPGSEREGEGPALARPHRADGRGLRPVRARTPSAGKTVSAYRDEPGVDPRSPDRDVRRRPAARATTGAGRDPVLPEDGQATSPRSCTRRSSCDSESRRSGSSAAPVSWTSTRTR